VCNSDHSGLNNYFIKYPAPVDGSNRALKLGLGLGLGLGFPLLIVLIVLVGLWNVRKKKSNVFAFRPKYIDIDDPFDDGASNIALQEFKNQRVR
jgi:hypothetical protein